MSKANDHRCCADSRCESGLKNHYYPGKRLTADSLRVEQEYQIDRRRLLNRAVFGWGVVYGYEVVAAPASDCHERPASGRLRIGAGLALDCCGRELVQVGKQAIALDDVFVVDANGKQLPRDKVFGETPGKPQQCWLLSVHYAEKHHDPVTVNDPCSCERHEHDHVCETVRYSLQPIPCEQCCRDWPCELECECGTGDCCRERPVDEDEHRLRDTRPPGYDQRAADDPEERRPPQPPRHEPPADHPPRRGGCRCLCDHLTGLELCDECGLCPVEDSCGKVWVDLGHGVPLACVEVTNDECDRPVFAAEVEPCGPRRLVKRNDLLYDLIRGCDLTRIRDISWAVWHRRKEPIDFADFSAAFGAEGARLDKYVTNFAVTFSRPVRASTLRPDCFAMTVLSTEREGGWWEPLRVPIVDLELIDESADHRLARGAKLVVDGAWVEDGLRGRHTVFLGALTRVEIAVRGDFILDCNDQAVDANAHGLDSAPSGNGVPGDELLSTFCVQAAPEEPSRHAYTTESRR